MKLHTKLGKPIPPAEPQLIHSKTPGTAATTAVTTTTAAAATTTPAAAVTAATTNTTTSTPTATAAPAVVKVVAGTPKINFLGKNSDSNVFIILKYGCWY